MQFTVRPAQPDQADQILALLPRLADFQIPSRRQPEELWTGDSQLVHKWAAGNLPDSVFEVAVSSQGEVVGVAFATLRPEALSQTPSAHLEVLSVAKEAEGSGAARTLVSAIEERVKELGAQSLTLNVFMNNERARGFYRHIGFDEELLRCIKDL